MEGKPKKRPCKTTGLVSKIIISTVWGYEKEIYNDAGNTDFKLVERLAESKQFIFAVRCADYCYFHSIESSLVPLKYFLTIDYIKRKCRDGAGTYDSNVRKMTGEAVMRFKATYGILYEEEPSSDLNNYLSDAGFPTIEEIEKMLADNNSYIGISFCARLYSLSDCTLKENERSKRKSASEYQALTYSLDPFIQAGYMRREGKGRDGSVVLEDRFKRLMVAGINDFDMVRIEK